MEPDYATRASVQLASKEGPLHIIVVSEVCLLREELAEILERDLLASVQQCIDLSKALTLSSAPRPDFILLDAALPEGTTVIAQARQFISGARFIVFAVREIEEEIIAWAEAGVIGYIPNTATRADVVRFVIDIHNGEQVCSARVAARLLRQISAARDPLADRSDPPLPGSHLTRRERQIADLIGIGLSNKEIARKLNISPGTAKSHVHNLLGKLNAHRRGQVAIRLREYQSVSLIGEQKRSRRSILMAE